MFFLIIKLINFAVKIIFINYIKKINLIKIRFDTILKRQATGIYKK